MKFSTFEEKMFTKRIWKKIVKGLSCLVVFCTVYALILPAITIEANAYCGQQEHKHTWSCYRREQICTKREHPHSQECFDDQGNLICSIEEHTHHSDCYEQVLDCAMTEHTHSLRCFSNPKADLEDEKDWKVPDPEDGQTKRERIVQTAKSQIGQKESSDNYLVQDETIKKGISRYGQWDGDDYEDWSGAFVRFVLEKSQADSTTKQAPKSVLDWMKELSKKEDLQVVDDAAAGDVLFIYDENDQEGPKAGIVTDIDEEAITAIMGDWNNEVKKERFSKEDDRLHSILKPVEDEFESQDNLNNNNNAQTGSNENQTNGSEWMDENNPDTPNTSDQDQPNQPDQSKPDQSDPSGRQPDQSNQSDQPSSNPDSSTSSDWTEEDEEKTSEDKQTETDKENNQKGQEDSQLNNKENKTPNNPNYNTNKTNRTEESYSNSKNSSDKSTNNSKKTDSSSISITEKADSNLPVPKPVKKEDTNKQETNEQEDKNKASGQTSQTKGDTAPDKQDSSTSKNIDSNADPDKDSDQAKDGEEDTAEKQENSDWDFTKEVTAKDGAVIRVSWNKGTFETDDVVFQAKAVELTEKEQKKLEGQLDKDRKYQFRNYDLTFYVRNDQFELEKVEPTKPVQVEIIPEDGNGQCVVFHHADTGEMEKVDQEIEESEENKESGSIRFKSDRFSVYTLASDSNSAEAISIRNNTDGYQALVNYAKEGEPLSEGQYLKLEEDVTVPANWSNGTISVTRDFRIDLNGHRLNNNKTSVLFDISNNANVKIFSSQSMTETEVTGSVSDKGVWDNNRGVSVGLGNNKLVEVRNAGILTADTGQAIVKISTGTLAMQNVVIPGGYAIEMNNSPVVTLDNCYLVNGSRGVNITNGGTLTVTDGFIANNHAKTTKDEGDETGVAIKASNKAVINLGSNDKDCKTPTIIQNNSLQCTGWRDYGGAIQLRGSTLNLYSAELRNNSINSDAHWSCGGAIAALCQEHEYKTENNQGIEYTWDTPSRVNMYDGALIDGNTAAGGGGGIFVQGRRLDSSVLDPSFEQACQFFMYGGKISNNIAETNEGGGIHLAAEYRTYAYLFAGEITGNRTTTQVHWGGGGIFVGEHSYMILPNGASIYGNASRGLGGGVTACSTGNIIFDESVVMANNTSLAQAWTGQGTEKPWDREYAQNHDGYNKPGDAKDFFSCLYASISAKLPNNLGGANYSGNVDYVPITNVNDGTITGNQLMGLINNAPKDTIEAALKISPLKIYDNESSIHGGGILVNGYLIGGEVEYLPSGPTMTFKADKQLLGEDGNPVNLGERRFEFELIDENDSVVATATNDSNGTIAFNPPLVHMPEMTGIVAADGKEFSEKATYRMREKNNPSSAVEMDQNFYTIEVTFKTKLTFVMTYPVYNDSGNRVKDISVYRADSEIANSSIVIKDSAGNPVTFTEENRKGSVGSMDHVTIALNPGQADFTNKLIPKKKITIKKTWKDENGNEIEPVGDMTAQFNVVRKPVGAPDDEYQQIGDLITLPTSDGKWEWTISDLDSNYDYDVREVNVDPLYSVAKTAENAQQVLQAWVRASAITPGNSYLIGSKNTEGEIVLLGNQTTTGYSEDRFGSDDLVTLTGVKGKTILIDGVSYADTFQDNANSNLLYTAQSLLFNGPINGFGLRNVNGTYTRVEKYDMGNISSLMLSSESNLTNADRSISLTSNGTIQQKLEGTNYEYLFDTNNGFFNTRLKATSGNPVYLYEQKSYSERVADHTIYSFVNQKKNEYQLNIHKQDAETKQPLKNVKFQLYSNSDLSEYNLLSFSVDANGYVFAEDGTLKTLETNEEGNISLVGLKPGTYYLKETETLDDYVLPESAIEITISSKADQEDGTADMVIHKTIDNHKAYMLPETGGPGVRFYTAAGTAMLISSFLLYEYSKKRAKKGGD